MTTQTDTMVYLLAVIKDYEQDGLEIDLLNSLFFQFLKLEVIDVEQAITNAKWEWAK